MTTVPRPYDGLPRVWHGSATSLNSPELAAKHGDPLFTANAVQPREVYAELIAHYRERFEAYGHDPADAKVAAGSGGLLIADSSQAAVAQYKELYEAKVRQTFKPHLAGKAGYNTPFRTIEDAIEGGPQLIGSPQQIVDKILGWHEVYRHDLQSITVDGFGLVSRSSWRRSSGSRRRSPRWCGGRRRPPCGDDTDPAGRRDAGAMMH